MSFDQYLMGLMFVLLVAASVWAWYLYESVRCWQQDAKTSRRLPAPRPMLPFVMVGSENTVRVSQRQNGKWVSQVFVPAVYA